MKTILVVDDNEADQFYNEMIFEENAVGVTLHKAYDGKEALAKLLNEGLKPDLILLDINMPGMNGYEFLDEWTKVHHEDIPIIVMLTSSEQDIDKDKALKYSCVHKYLTKPIDAHAIDALRTLSGCEKCS